MGSCEVVEQGVVIDLKLLLVSVKITENGGDSWLKKKTASFP